MNFSICFITSGGYSLQMLKVANELKKKDVYWIVTSKKIFNIISEFFDDSKILYLNKSFCNIEGLVIGEYKINELIYGDRAWKYDKNNGHLFLKNIQAPIYDFIKKNKIEYCIGELTLSHELLINRIVNDKKELGCTFLFPLFTRIPDNRILFFLDERQRKFVEIHIDNVDIYPQIDLSKIEKPAYLEELDAVLAQEKTVGGIVKKIKNFIYPKWIDENDPLAYKNRFIWFIQRVSIEVNKKSFLLLKLSKPNDFNIKKYVLYALHKQPESSIDVVGRYNEDQLQIIKNIWRILPTDWCLIVKEHSNAVGDRSILFFKELEKYSNIFFADPYSNSHEWIKNAEAIFTISGTIGIEAALMLKPVITFTPIFYNYLNYCQFINIDELNNLDIIELIKDIKTRKDNGSEYLKYIVNNSFETRLLYIDDDPKALSDENCINFAKSICIAIKNVNKHNEKPNK